MKSSTNRALVAKKQSTSFAQVANNLLNLLQGYTKGIRFTAILTLLFTLGVGSMLGETATNNCGSALSATATDMESGKLIQWKVSSTNSYSNPIRVYANTTITITAKSGVKRITQVEVTASSTGNYVTNTEGATWTASGNGTCTVGTKSVSGKVITVPMNGDVTTVTIKPSVQTRWSKVVVTYELDASCDKKVTVNKGTPSNGSFSISKTGTYETCDAPLVITLSNITPSAGYQFGAITQTGIGTGVTIDQANKTVTYDKNTSGTSTINVTFEQKQSATINLSEAGVETGVAGKYIGDSYTLPSTTSQSCGDLEFVGWSTVEINNSASKPASNYYAKGASVTLVANQTFHAVFAKETTINSGNIETTITIPNETLIESLSGSYGDKSFSCGGYTFNLNACVQSSYCQMRDNSTISYIQIPTLPGPITKISCTDCKNASGSAYTGTLHFKTSKTRGNSDTNDIDKITYTSVNSFEWEIDNDTHKTGYLLTSAGLRLKNLSITYITSGETITYSDYTTQCTTEPSQLATPTGLKVTNITSTSATLSWNAVTHATSYTVQVYGENDEIIAEYTDLTQTTKEVSGLESDTYYIWAVTAIGDGTTYTDSEESETADFTTQKACTDAVDIRKGTPSNGSFTMVSGYQPTCNGPVTVTLSDIQPDAGYQFSTITQSGVGDAKVTIDNDAKTVTYAQNTTGTSTINIIFTEIPKRTVTLNPNYPAGKTGTFTYEAGELVDGSLVLSYDHGTASMTIEELYTSLTLDGYEFGGWHNAKGVSLGEVSGSKCTTTGIITSNKTYYAKWTPVYTVTWLANGQEFHTQTAVEGNALDLPDSEPDAATFACNDKVFVGWTATQIDGSPDTEPADLFTTKNINVEAASTTYYAVFATADAGGSTTDTYDWESDQTGNWTVDAAITRTQSQGVDGSYAGKINTNNTYVTYNNKVAVTNFSFDFKRTSNNTNYKVYIETSTDNSTWTSAASYEMSSFGNGSYTSKFHTFDGTQDLYVRFHCYNTTAIRYVDNVSITYGGTSYSDYTTTCVEVQKYEVTYTKGDGATGTAPTETPKAEGTIFTLASADGISKEGYSFAGWLCDNDDKIYGASEEYTMPKADVTFTAQWNELPKYTVTFNNKGKKHSEVTQTIANAPIECPTGLVACDGYTFAGWSTEELDGVSSFSKIEGEYTPTENITLYAVYAEGNATTNGWVKVTDLSTITEGTYALLSNNDYAFNGTINNNSDGEHTTNTFDFNGEGMATEAPSGTCEIELIASGDGFKMYSEGKGYLYAKAAKSGNLAWSQTENGSWSWNSTKSNWVYAENDAFLRSYSNTFRTYGTNNGNAIYFAKKNVTSFTTSPACDPMITIGSEAPVMVTSAKNIRVDAVQNITISATNLDQNADEAQVSIKIVSNNSAFKFKEVGANGDGQATSTWTGIANATFDKTLCVTYTPTVSGREETATLTVTAYRHNGSTEYATATMQVRGRSLPEQFVLVANTTDGWVALPNTLGTGSSSSIPYPIAVEVDNNANPTSIPQAPSTTIYKAAARSSVNDVPTGLRFTTEAGGYLQASTSETNIWLSSNNSENMQSWTLNSTDFVDYSIRVNDAAEGHYLNYNNTQKKIGNYKSDNKLRILPVGAVCEQHAAPEDIEASSVRATSATIQWSAVSTATAGYEYRIGATGEWTKIGNVTELELTKLSPLTNHIVYVRASVEGAIINCSNEAKVSFTTVSCDDVPTNITHTSSSQSITVSWEAKAATSIVKLYSDQEGTTEVKSIESSSPCTLSDLEKYTTYYVQILAGGTCPSQIIEVSTLIPNINIAEWMEDGILVDVDTDEDVSVIIENEESYGSGSGQVAEDLFFSKYFEATGNVKLLALYNGTNADIDLTQYSIKFSNKGKDYTGSNYTEVDYEATVDLSEDLPENRRTLIAGQELILISYANDGSSNSKPITNPDGTTSNVNQSDYGVLACAAENKQESGWDRYIRVTSPALNFSGNDAIALYKNTELIDIIGGGNASKANMTTVVSPAQTFMDAAGWYNAAGYEIVDLKPSQNKDYALSTNRCLLVRLNSVISGAKAVEKNTTDFVTLGGEFGEWMGKQIPDDDAACDGFKYVGGYNYSEYYTKYNTVGSEQVFPGENRTDGTVKITIEGLPNYSCHNIKLNLKIGEDLKLTEITKVPILISDEQTTKITSSTFTTLKSTLGVIDPETKEKTDLTDEQLIEKCETCDIVVLANGKLTHETDGIDQFRDLTIYPEGTFHNNDNISVDRLLVHAKRDEVGCAIIENEGVTLTTNAIAHTKRIDAQYWYPFSLPYNCNIADITQANGESLGTYGVHWGIQYYDGKKRQESGTSAGIGQSSNFWTPIYNSNEQLKAYQGYMIALFDASVSSPTEMRTIYFPPVSAQMYTESGIDSKETTITSWNVNLEAEKRHHGWNFTGSPYISVFNPQATGLSEDRGLLSEVLIVSGHYDQGSNEYLYDDEYVYVSIPSPNGAKYYDQYITSATSLKPFTAYFVQAIDPTSGNDETQTLAYAKAGRELPTSAPRRSTSTRQRVLVELGVTAPDGQTDNTGIWVDEKYTSAYEIAADLTKMYVAGDRPQLYTMAEDNEKMAYNALPDEMAGNVQLGLYAPTAGSYTLFINERVSRLKGVERVDLLYNNVVVADLLSSAYVIDVPKKGAVNGYTISVCRKANVTTAIDNISGQPINIITGDGYLTLEGIVSDAQVSVYDMLGRLVAAQNANDETNIRIPFIVQGVYNVVVKNEQGMTTIKVVLR